jgi:hypothetical protein
MRELLVPVSWEELAKNNEFLAGHAFDFFFGVFYFIFNPREMVVICQKWFSDLLLITAVMKSKNLLIPIVL